MNISLPPPPSGSAALVIRDTEVQVHLLDPNLRRVTVHPASSGPVSLTTTARAEPKSGSNGPNFKGSARPSQTPRTCMSSPGHGPSDHRPSKRARSDSPTRTPADISPLTEANVALHSANSQPTPRAAEGSDTETESDIVSLEFLNYRYARKGLPIPVEELAGVGRVRDPSLVFHLSRYYSQYKQTIPKSLLNLALSMHAPKRSTTQ
ncbi:hypothetical protein PENSPDRAFT_731227 [Peniophora sp. CONT]|nr:hypothetical protein PENSPDRAFT_731227 [Peniophora sp. CONT]